MKKLKKYEKCKKSKITGKFSENRKTIAKKSSNLLKKIRILIENLNFGQKSNFSSKLNSSSKIKIYVKTQNCCENSKFSSQLKIFVINKSFRQKEKFSSKIKMFVINKNFRQKKYKTFYKNQTKNPYLEGTQKKSLSSKIAQKSVKKFYFFLKNVF